MRTDADLLSSHTPEDFGEFYERHVTAVTAYVARRTRKPDLIFDLVAETFARALEHRRTYEPRKGPAVAWLFGIARNLMVDAERKGQVADAARVRLNMEPVALDDEQIERVVERSRIDLIEALGQLPESQRIAVIRRVLGEQEYDAIAGHVGCSDRWCASASRAGWRRCAKGWRHDEPGPVRRPQAAADRCRRRAEQDGPQGRIVLLVAALVLGLAAAATAAVTLTDSEPSKPMAGVLPSPSPGATPPAATPTTPPRPNQTPPTQPRAAARAHRRGRRRDHADPDPERPTDYTVELMPDLTAGTAGWCVGVSVRNSGFRAGGRGCGPAGPPGTHLIAGGGLIGRHGPHVRGRRPLGRHDPPQQRPPDHPQARPRRSARLARRDLGRQRLARRPTARLHAPRQQRPRAHRPPEPGRPRPLPTRKVNAKRPPKARCAIRAKSNSGLRPVSARLLTKFETLDVVRPSYLSCSTTVIYVGDAPLPRRGPAQRARPQGDGAPAPAAPNSISARRVGPGWLVVFGGRTKERERVLRSLRVTKP